MAKEEGSGVGCRGVGLATVDLQAIVGRSLTLSLSEIEASGGF